ncbi:MAG: AarF/ABC1/UbiB kinase family protein, partial [Verrucomicrobia bacterium]|nr:AarF/ABC1/UbiB kinase family protein [Cytophagales bacterium]
SQLKGSALKVAQMMSMDRSMLPKAYKDRFQMAQYSAPPLSAPLVIKTFQKYFGKTPSQIFDSFDLEAVNAASIGQVHAAYKDGKKLAVKVQYPGVAASIAADLRMVKPFAVSLLGLNEADVDNYTKEVEERLLEETNYVLELQRSIEISQACSHIDHLIFPTYYPELSCERILTMDWMPGMHLREFIATNPTQEVRNKIGQAMWNFYDFQMHNLRKIHADPHPGNFLIQEDGRLGIIDFGCIKEIPKQFYDPYFKMVNPHILNDPILREKAFFELEILKENDTPQEKAFFTEIFTQMSEMLTRPFQHESFDFGDDAYFDEIFDFGEKISKMKEIRETKVARASRHTLYVNRTYFGLYSILNELKANINISKPTWLLTPPSPTPALPEGEGVVLR